MSLRSGSKICHFELGIFKLKVNISYHEIFFVGTLRFCQITITCLIFFIKSRSKFFIIIILAIFFNMRKKLPNF
jgi:hypothetical protein